ncbi:MAG TPA: hypothetical protein VD794_02930 [Flavisolibacter sp.]|nr:hypothetical protein [Flavisolibacter sp.]
MKKALYAFAIVLLAVSSTSAQQPTTETSPTIAQTQFFAELGGPGVLFSANIDRRFKKSHIGWGGRVGLGFVSGDYSYNDVNGYYYERRSVVTIPVQINYVFGKANSPHTFEAGAGFTVLGKKMDVFNIYTDDRSSVLGTAAFMYRRQPLNGGFAWRIGFTPVVYSGYIQASGGVSVGYAF